jgi:hypothetical protein
LQLLAWGWFAVEGRRQTTLVDPTVKPLSPDP